MQQLRLSMRGSVSVELFSMISIIKPALVPAAHSNWIRAGRGESIRERHAHNEGIDGACDVQAMRVLKHRPAIEHRSWYSLSRGFFTAFINDTLNDCKTNDIPSIVPFYISWSVGLRIEHVEVLRRSLTFYMMSRRLALSNVHAFEILK